jgi:hypothetical protein
LKKGEIKVTVIATGFPTDTQKRSLFQKNDSVISQSKTETLESIFKETPKQEQPELIKKQEQTEDDDLFIDDTDDWSTVPAFLRRNKK